MEWGKKTGIISGRYSSRIIDRTCDKLDVKVKKEEILVSPKLLSWETRQMMIFH